MIYSSNQNGADYFIRRAGRRVLICEKAFFEWVNMSEVEKRSASPQAIAFYKKIKRR
jgi:hypothetical protein